MAEPTDGDIALSRIARRLTRLLGAERTGRFNRCPPDMTKRLLERRQHLIEQLIGATGDGQPLPPHVKAAFADLARETKMSRRHVESRIERLAAELQWRRGASPTGLRGSGGDLIGRG